MVCCCAFDKGRSQSWALNAVCRQLLAYSAGAGLRPRWRHVRSEHCAADYDSRVVSGERMGEPPPEARRSGPARGAEAAPSRKGSNVMSGDSVTKEEAAGEEPAKLGPPADAPARRNARPRPDTALEAVVRALLREAPGEDEGRTARRRGLLRPDAVFLELYSGSGRLSEEMARQGFSMGPTHEVKEGVDLRDEKVFRALLCKLREGRVHHVHLGVPCRAWSCARRGITNLDRARRVDTDGVEHALIAVAVIWECERVGATFSLENPRSSRLWRFPPVAELLGWPNVSLSELHMCQFGCAYKKPTFIMSNLPCGDALSRRCSGGHAHERLRGKCKEGGGWKSRTEAAGVYPWSLCRCLARAIGATCHRAASGDPEWLRRWHEALASPQADAVRPQRALGAVGREDAPVRAAAWIAAHGAPIFGYSTKRREVPEGGQPGGRTLRPGRMGPAADAVRR